MRYEIMRDTDLKVSNLCLGGGGFGEKLDREISFAILDAFVRQGGNFIDTANIYCKWVPGLGNCSERVLGEWLKARGAFRDVVIATKGGHYLFGGEENTSRVNEREIRKDLEESLRTFGLDEIDFYWLHRDDEEKPIEEIVDILEKLRKEGKIRYYGLSNYHIERVKAAREYLRGKGLSGPYAVSNQWSLASINPGGNTNPDPTLVEFSLEEYKWHQSTGVPSIPFSSTAMGFFEKVKRGQVSPDMRKAYWNEENLKIYHNLLSLEKETGQSLQTLSVAYLLNQPFQVFPVGGVRNVEQLDDFLRASELRVALKDYGAQRFG